MEKATYRGGCPKNLCVSLLGKTETSYYSTLNETNVIVKQKLWKTMTPMLSNKLVNNEKITLVKNEKIITDDKEIEKVLNGFFSNVIKFLSVSQTNHSDSNFENARDPTFKATLNIATTSAFLQ